MQPKQVFLWLAGTGLLAVAFTAIAACGGRGQQPADLQSASGGEAPERLVSLLGDTLALPLFDEETTARLEAEALEAARNLEADPSAENFVWMGRRLAYLWRYDRAIAVFTNGLRAYPTSPELYRHRGHRYITVRRFDDAVADLETAAELIRGRPDAIEPDGAPNRLNIPRSTLHFNIWYHLGLAHYLRGDFERAAEAFGNALSVALNDDTRVAATDWLYMSLRRRGLHDAAAALLDDISPVMDIIENGSYHRRLLMYKGVMPADSLLQPDAEALDLATQGYGVANWHHYNGRAQEARELFQRIARGDYWPAFGVIAAEAELARSAP